MLMAVFLQREGQDEKYYLLILLLCVLLPALLFKWSFMCKYLECLKIRKSELYGVLTPETDRYMSIVKSRLSLLEQHQLYIMHEPHSWFGQCNFILTVKTLLRLHYVILSFSLSFIISPCQSKIVQTTWGDRAVFFVDFFLHLSLFHSRNIKCCKDCISGLEFETL